MKRKLNIDIVANILEEDVEFIRNKIDKNEFKFAHKNKNGKYFINSRLFEKYLLSRNPYFLKVHGYTRRYK